MWGTAPLEVSNDRGSYAPLSIPDGHVALIFVLKNDVQCTLLVVSDVEGDVAAFRFGGFHVWLSSQVQSLRSVGEGALWKLQR